MISVVIAGDIEKATGQYRNYQKVFVLSVIYVAEKGIARPPDLSPLGAGGGLRMGHGQLRHGLNSGWGGSRSNDDSVPQMRV